MIVRWSELARAELSEQLAYIALDKPSAAERMSYRVEDVVLLLGSFPLLGKRLVSGAYEFVIPATPFLLIYELRNELLIISRFLHGAQSR